ncbi:TetR family transcriptional regulator [Streptomyces sp. NPDC049881]|uniref:TetR/AcrR family transcriptional regulator n=1 Tax=Streptomyces sp. NPDC049881 TaxID=3155778 RepID=UPI00341D466E
MAGLRERKKEQTRRHLSDVATGLFLERGFDVVTVAEIAEAAEVSVNTVYNYFPAKENLFLDREDEQVERPSRRVRERAPGESAAEAVLRAVRRDVEERRPWVGLTEGYERFMRVLFGSPTLMAFLQRMQYRTCDRLAETLREETGAAPGDPMPDLVAGLMLWLTNSVYRIAGADALAGVPVDETAARMLAMLDDAESLLGAPAWDYARRPAAS